MKSGIFHKGGLKGRPLARDNQDYVIYFFKDLVSFILVATSYLISEKPQEYLRYYISAFDRAINNIDELKFIVSYYRSKTSSNKLIRIKKDLEDIKSKLTSKPVIALPPRFKEGGDNVDSLIRLFKQQLPPTTSEKVISEAILTILHTFNIFFIGSEGISQRMKRMKRAK
jgi:hypothetical protein